MKIGSVKLSKKRKGGMYVGAPATKLAKAARYDWTLCSSPWHAWRKTKLRISAESGVLLEELLAIDGALAPQARAAAAMLVKIEFTFHEFLTTWEAIVADNHGALAVTVTDHRNYAYARSSTVLRWHDDVDAPTSLPPDLRRQQERKTFLSGPFKRNFDEAMKAHGHRARTPDVIFTRPDLYRELEPIIRELQARGRELLRQRKQTKLAAREIANLAETQTQAVHYRSATAQIATADNHLRRFEEMDKAPDSIQIEELQASVELEKQAWAEGEKVWKTTS